MAWDRGMARWVTLPLLMGLANAACSEEEPNDDPEEEVPSSGGSPAAGGSMSSSGSTGGTIQTVDEFSISESAGVYTLVHGGVTMVVDPGNGGRITSFGVDGVETLVQEGAAAQYGSTFWPSPQTWEWPPSSSIAEIDSQPYSVAEGAQSLVLTSAADNHLGAVVTKTFAAAQGTSGALGISVTYTIENASEQSFGAAPWEVSRVAGGTVVFPAGPGGELEQSTLSAQTVGNHSFYTYDATDLSEVPKILADGSNGWLAWADDAGSSKTLVIKAFDDISPAQFADGEAEIEIYADPSGSYMEVEQQGAFEELAPGASLSWTVIWLGVSADPSVSIEVGSESLVDLIENTL